MSGFLSSLFGSGERHRFDPNQQFQQEMFEKIKPTPKPNKLGPTIMGGVSGLILDSSTFEVTKTVVIGAKEVLTPIVTPIATAAKENIVEPVKTSIASSTLPGVETVSHGVNFVYTGASDLFSYARSAASLASWTFKLLPTGVQFGLGCLGLYLAYAWWRQGSTQKQEVTVNINFHGMTTQPLVQQNGQAVDVTIPSPPAVPSSTPKPSAQQRWQEAVQKIQESKEQNKELSAEDRKMLAIERWTKAVKEIQDQMEAAAKLHKTLSKYKEEQSTMLSPHIEKINGLLERFQQIEDKKYAQPDVLPLVTESRAIIKEIRKTIEIKQKTVINALKA